MRRNARPVNVCPKCGNTRPTVYDPIGCDKNHEWTKMIPLALPVEVFELKVRKAPAGAFKYISMLAWIGVFVAILCWIWMGDWRFAPTAILLTFLAILTFGASLKEVKDGQN